MDSTEREELQAKREAGEQAAANLGIRSPAEVGRKTSLRPPTLTVGDGFRFGIGMILAQVVFFPVLVVLWIILIRSQSWPL